MAKKKFPDLTGDGKVTQADILKGRGVKGFSKGKSVRVPMEPDQETLDLIEQEIRETGFSETQERIEATMAGEQDGPAIKNKKQKRRVNKESVGKFESGGVVKAAILIMDSGPQPEKAQVKGTRFSGNY